MITEIGDYKILKPLESRGYGDSYLAEQKSLGRRVILKLLLVTSDRALEQFRKEAQRLVHLEDGRIANVHGFGEEENFFYFSMEAPQGVSFAELLHRVERCEGEPDLEELLPSNSWEKLKGGMDATPSYRDWIVHWIAEIAEALDTAHVRGFIHRDMRPENLFIEPDGKPMIGDFGLARSGADQSLSTGSEKFVATEFWSPEQSRRSAPVDLRADIYSLGMVLRKMLAPESGALPANLEKILQVATARDAVDRYSRARDFSQDLRRYLAGDPVSVKPVGKIRKVIRSVARNPLGQATGIAVMALALSFSFFHANLNGWRDKVADFLMGTHAIPAKVYSLLPANDFPNLDAFMDHSIPTIGNSILDSYKDMVSKERHLMQAKAKEASAKKPGKFKNRNIYDVLRKHEAKKKRQARKRQERK